VGRYLRPLPLGVAGTIYKTNLTTLMDLGITRHQSLATLRKLHIHAISCLHNITTERRYLERFQRHTKDHGSRTRNVNCSIATRRGQDLVLPPPSLTYHLSGQGKLEPNMGSSQASLYWTADGVVFSFLFFPHHSAACWFEPCRSVTKESASDAANVKFSMHFQMAGLLPLSASQHANAAQVHTFTLQQLSNIF